MRVGNGQRAVQAVDERRLAGAVGADDRDRDPRRVQARRTRSARAGARGRAERRRPAGAGDGQACRRVPVAARGERQHAGRSGRGGLRARASGPSAGARRALRAGPAPGGGARRSMPLSTSPCSSDDPQQPASRGRGSGSRSTASSTVARRIRRAGDAQLALDVQPQQAPDSPSMSAACRSRGPAGIGDEALRRGARRGRAAGPPDRRAGRRRPPARRGDCGGRSSDQRSAAASSAAKSAARAAAAACAGAARSGRSLTRRALPLAPAGAGRCSSAGGRSHHDAMLPPFPHPPARPRRRRGSASSSRTATMRRTCPPRWRARSASATPTWRSSSSTTARPMARARSSTRHGDRVRTVLLRQPRPEGGLQRRLRARRAATS